LADFHSAISCDQFIHSADDSHGQRSSASAHVHLAHRKSTHFDTGSCGDDIGYNELTAIIFGQVLETRVVSIGEIAFSTQRAKAESCDNARGVLTFRSR
jgi:hypothetical protein